MIKSKLRHSVYLFSFRWWKFLDQQDFKYLSDFRLLKWVKHTVWRKVKSKFKTSQCQWLVIFWKMWHSCELDEENCLDLNQILKVIKFNFRLIVKKSVHSLVLLLIKHCVKNFQVLFFACLLQAYFQPMSEHNQLLNKNSNGNMDKAI